MADKDMADKKIILIIAHEGFEFTEYSTTKEVLERAGYPVVTASNKLGKATSSNGQEVPVDLLLEKINPEDVHAVIFIGGTHAIEALDTDDSYTLLREVNLANNIVAGIGIGTRILAKSDVLQNKKATGCNEDGFLSGLFEQCGVTLVEEPVVVFKNAITATGPDAALMFAQHLVTELTERSQPKE